MGHPKIIEAGHYGALDLKSGADPDDVIIIKDFVPAGLCQRVIDHCHRTMKTIPHRETIDDCFFSFDVLPVQSATARIFRTLNFLSLEGGMSAKPVCDLFGRLIEFQRQHVLKDPAAISGNRPPRMQVIHYPRGGGFLDWHVHARNPVNYGLILNLSRRGTQFSRGGTEIEDRNGQVICVEDHSNQGDLILFKFDLNHRVSPCDADMDLHFDLNGRWTAVLPID